MNVNNISLNPVQTQGDKLSFFIQHKRKKW